MTLNDPQMPLFQYPAEGWGGENQGAAGGGEEEGGSGGKAEEEGGREEEAQPADPGGERETGQYLGPDQKRFVATFCCCRRFKN